MCTMALPVHKAAYKNLGRRGAWKVAQLLQHSHGRASDLIDSRGSHAIVTHTPISEGQGFGYYDLAW
jgi:hypothetical protein